MKRFIFLLSFLLCFSSLQGWAKNGRYPPESGEFHRAEFYNYTALQGRDEIGLVRIEIIKKRDYCISNEKVDMFYKINFSDKDALVPKALVLLGGGHNFIKRLQLEYPYAEWKNQGKNKITYGESQEITFFAWEFE